MRELINGPFPQCYSEVYNRIFTNEKPLFTVVGDLNLNSKYSESAICVTKDRVYAFDKGFEGLYITVLFEQIKQIRVKRMYGNAVMFADTHDGERVRLMRFTFAAANAADAAKDFIEAVKENGYSEELLYPVENTFEKQRCFCPKCGRKLSSPDAECLNCKGKGKMFSKFAKYAVPYKGSLAACMLLSIFTTGMSLIPPYITGYMVDSVLPSGQMNMLAKMICILLGVYILQYSVSAYRAYLLRLTGDKIVIGLKKDIYEKAQYLPMSFYDKTSTGSVINRVNSDAGVIQNFVMKLSQEAVVQLFTMIGILVIMICLNWKLTLFSLVPVPIVALMGRAFGKKLSPKYMRIWRRSAAISTLLADTIPGIRVVKAFTNETNVVKKFDAYCDAWLDEDTTVAKISGIFPQLMTFLVTCGTLIIWFSGGSFVISGQEGFSTGLLVSFISYASMFYNPVNFFANLSDVYQNTLASAEKILDILDAEPEHDFGKENVPERIDGKIEFKNVNFSFDRSKKVLSNINLTIEPGDVVGIVGTTGSGKSTLINLIMRYYDDYEGEILIDGKNLRDIDMSYYRSQIGFVQQEPLMFKDTVFNNIAYGSPSAHVEQVLRAADIANAHGFISRLPDGYDTLLGERGTGVSGGERQRISIARAVMKNPAILIFDAATAAVDSETEHLIQEAIERLIRGRTTLMIAHRLSTLRNANKIVVVDKGEIIECGTPQELMELKGKYYKLIQIQSMGEQLQAKKKEENFE
ncbi:MAG: ABC transporter ATP-binding protein/permease [Clostridia bacterium]|nr:ABC transporter ATP-binding protein/permease [Clostridia bacterium]